MPSAPSGVPPTAVLLSGGLDSAVLLAREAAHQAVQPVYVSVGLAWEDDELAIVDRLLAAPPLAGRVKALARLAFSMRDVYTSSHWAVQGTPPAYDTPDEDVYLAGRNIVLLAKAGVLCAQLGLHRIVIGPLAGNPFPDATPDFFASMARTLSLGLAHPLTIDAPFADRHKSDVILIGRELGVPFDLTLSCMSPEGGGHCGRCSKCRERHDAFHEAGLPDPTIYATPPPR
ncbi:MAG: 7-cyano-7-deazaguanine synthase [Acidobacteriota bacterium]|nr:7-cyano-7-deazaguanine synthase [Acidobacteriota bacterium]